MKLVSKDKVGSTKSGVSVLPTVLTLLFALFVGFVIIASAVYVHKNEVDILPVNEEMIKDFIKI